MHFYTLIFHLFMSSALPTEIWYDNMQNNEDNWVENIPTTGTISTTTSSSFCTIPSCTVVRGQESSITRTTDISLYTDISLQFDYITHNIQTDEYCIIDYNTNGTWIINAKLNPKTLSTSTINYNFPANIDTANQLIIRLRTNGGDGDTCYYDQIYLRGTLITSSTTTFSPTTTSPTTLSPSTVSPTTFQPTTIQPTTYNPTTYNPTTTTPTSTPTTPIPTTAIPTTVIPTTYTPTTAAPTTVIPTTTIPTTGMPTTAIPTTVIPTTAIPSTSIPTTAIPSTVNPSTSIPTTLIPTMTSTVPTTVSPTTSSPTFSSTTTPTATPIHDGNVGIETSSASKEDNGHLNKTHDGSIWEDNSWLLFVVIVCVIGICCIIAVIYAKKRRQKKHKNMENNIEMHAHATGNGNNQYGFVLHQSPQSIMSIHSPSTTVNTLGGRTTMSKMILTPKQHVQTNEFIDDDGLYTTNVNSEHETAGNDVNVTKGNNTNGEGIMDGYDDMYTVPTVPRVQTVGSDSYVTKGNHEYINDNENQSDDDDNNLYKKPIGSETAGQ